VNNGIFGLDSPPSRSLMNDGILNIPSSVVPSILGQSENRGADVDYNNLVFLFDTNLEADNIVSFSFSGTVNCFVDWGDGAVEVFKTTGTKSHTYPSKGRYIVQIGGLLSAITFQSMVGSGKLISCLSFGKLPNLSACRFRNCSNLREVPNNIPATFTSLSSMFALCNNFNSPAVLTWDTSRITSLNGTFFQNTRFQQPINVWNTSNVTDMGAMCEQGNFNQDLNSWNTSKVTSMSLTFAGSYTNGFNGDISSWDVSNVTNMNQTFYLNQRFNRNIGNWDVSKVTNISNMFYQSVFNQYIGDWNVSSVQTMRSTFQQSSFNQDISNWNFRGLNNSNSLEFFFNISSAFSTINYNLLLISWNNNKISGPYRSDLRPTMSNKTYYANSAASAARAALVAYGWTITDGGPINAIPDAPTSVAGTAGDTQVSLTWNAPTYDNGASITDYTIQYSSNSGSSWTTFSDTVSSSTSVIVTGLTNGLSYIFRVAAVNSVGTGAYSISSSAITPSI
jgi:surface protein